MLPACDVLGCLGYCEDCEFVVLVNCVDLCYESVFYERCGSYVCFTLHTFCMHVLYICGDVDS